jgi:hypothetical protein
MVKGVFAWSPFEGTTYTAILVGTCARPVEDFDRSPDLVEMIGKKEPLVAD